MNKQIIARFFCITLCLLSIQNNLIGQSTQHLLTKLTSRYGQTPEQRCKDAGCKNAEQCLLLVLQKLNFDRGNVKKSLINNILENDKQDLSGIKSDHTQSWLWSFIAPIDQKMLDTYNTATTLQKNRDETATFIDEHVSCIQGYERIKFYSGMPTDSRLLPSWITTNRFAQEKFPLQSYKDKVASDLQFIRDLSQQDLHNYPDLADKLEETKKQLTRSIGTIENAFREECTRAQEYRHKEAVIKKEKADIEHSAQRLKIEQQNAQAAVNLVKAQEEENNAIRQLQSILYNLSWSNLNLLSSEELLKSREQIGALKAKISERTEEKRALHHKINNELAKLQRCIDDENSRQEIKQLQNKVSNLPTDKEIGKRTYDSIRNTVAQAVERQNASIAPLNKKIEKLKQELKERPVLAHAEGVPMAYAEVSPIYQNPSDPYAGASAPPMPAKS